MPTDSQQDSWLQASVLTHSKHCALLEELFYALGAVSITLSDAQDQPILEPGVGETPLWQDVTLSVLFAATSNIESNGSDSELETLESSLKKTLSTQAEGTFESLNVSRLENKNWERECLDQFKPIFFPNRLRICPSWDYQPEAERIDILLDPGLAFGTGSHPTTFMCLEWLDANPIADKKVIDFGCGSGILGIAALKLGAKQVTFIDNDPQAITATRENMRRNAIDEESCQLICNGSPTRTEQEALNELKNHSDILLANILAQPLVDLASTISGFVKANGSLILSGLLAEQQSLVLAAYENQFSGFNIKQTEDWLCISATKI